MKKLSIPVIIFVVFCLSVAFTDGYAVKTVKMGESLGSIANSYQVSVSALTALNELESSTIHPGDVIKVPFMEARGGVYEQAPLPPPSFRAHVLAEGENLSEIALRYNLSLQALVGANPDISSLDSLPAGIELLIPPELGLAVVLSESLTLKDILASYDVSPLELLQVNGFSSPLELQSGRMVFLPGVEPKGALERLAKVREEENRYIWPVHGRITSYFGRRNLGMGTANFHSAIDVAAPTGTPVVAARSGTVTYADWSRRGYGNLVKVQHKDDSETWYAHHSKILVSVGDYVRQGETIALVGSTGLSTGPHLHFEVREKGKAIDPLVYLR